MNSNEGTARGNRKPVREITNQGAAGENFPEPTKRDEKLQAQRHLCGVFLPFSGRFSSLQVAKPVEFGTLSGQISAQKFWHKRC